MCDGAPAMPRFSQLGLEDVPRCLDLSEAVGWPRETEKWRLLLSLGQGFGALDATGALEAVVTMPEHDGATFVAMMLVHPSQQGRGLGRALLEHARALVPSPLMLYATPAGRPLYEKLGFVAVDGVSKHIGVPERTQMPAGVTAHGAEVLPALAALDAAAYGVPRPRLFSALVPLVRRVVRDGDGGFALRWFNGELEVVGPVVAATEAAAIALIDGVLVGAAGRVRIDVSERSRAVAAHIAGRGLFELAKAPLMTWPERFLPGDRARYHAIVLQAFG